MALAASCGYLCPMSAIQSDTYDLRGYECDALGRISIPTLMNWMQESANRNAIAYGIGIDELARRDLDRSPLGWMLMRFRLRMHHYPLYGQSVRVVTYPTFVEKYFIHRDFRVLAEDGSLLAEAGSTWLVFDMDKRTMVPLPGFIRTLTPPADIEPLPTLPLKPPFQNQTWEPTRQTDVPVGWFSIDQNQHVNNVAYIQWLLESMDQQTLETAALAELDVVYRTESHWQDQLLIQSTPDTTDAHLHRIVQASSGRDVLLARTQWRPNPS